VTAGHSTACLLAALALAGCALIAPPPPKPPHPAPLAHHPRPPASGTPAGTGPSGSAAAAAALPHPAPAPAPAAPAEEPLPAPIDVVGLSQSEVRTLLGPPTARVAQGANETWTYRAPGCAVEVAFYYDVSRSAFFALSQRLTGGKDAQHCLAQVHAAHPS
jgi:hypothetical protein